MFSFKSRGGGLHFLNCSYFLPFCFQRGRSVVVDLIPKDLFFCTKDPNPWQEDQRGKDQQQKRREGIAKTDATDSVLREGHVGGEAPSGSQTGELSLLGRRRGCSDRVNSSILSTSPRGTSPTPAPLSSFLHRRVHSIAAWYIYLFIVGKRECLFLQLLPGSSQETNGFHTFQPVSVAGSSHSGPGFPLQSADHSRGQG